MGGRGAASYGNDESEIEFEAPLDDPELAGYYPPPGADSLLGNTSGLESVAKNLRVNIAYSQTEATAFEIELMDFQPGTPNAPPETNNPEVENDSLPALPAISKAINEAASENRDTENRNINITQPGLEASESLAAGLSKSGRAAQAPPGQTSEDQLSVPTEQGEISLTRPEQLGRVGLTGADLILANGTEFTLISEATDLDKSSEDLFGFKLAPQHYIELASAPAGSQIELFVLGDDRGVYLSVYHPDYGEADLYVERNEHGTLKLVIETCNLNYPHIQGGDYSRAIRLDSEATSPKREYTPEEYQDYNGNLDFNRERGPGLIANENDESAVRLPDGSLILARSVNVLNKKSKELFGYSLDVLDYARIIAAPGGSKVTVEEDYSWDGIEIVVTHPYYDGQERVLHLEAGRLEIHHSLWQVSRTSPAGIGRQIFREAVAAYLQYGISKITTHAAGNYSTIQPGRGAGTNGYYTWARFGFTAALTEKERTKLPANLAQATTVNELLDLAGGKEWWLTNGTGRQMEFDLSGGSSSRKRFDRYWQEKEGAE